MLERFINILKQCGTMACSIRLCLTKQNSRALRSLLAEELKKVSASKRDDSIAQIFLEKANGWLNKPEGAAPSSDEWRATQVVVQQVLPAYYAALKPAAPRQQRAGRTATLTLVRWPYT